MNRLFPLPGKGADLASSIRCTRAIVLLFFMGFGRKKEGTLDPNPGSALEYVYLTRTFIAYLSVSKLNIHYSV